MSMPEEQLTHHPYIVLRPSQRERLERYAKYTWAAFGIYTLVMLTGVLNGLDQRMVLGLWREIPRINEVARITELPGLRGIVYPVTIAVAMWLAFRRRDLHPPITAVSALIATNAATGVAKLITFRATPRQGGPEFFNTDFWGLGAYPSGHAANLGCAVTLGVLAMFASRVRWRYVMTVLLVLVFLEMSISSWARDTHWVSDLVSGALLGAAVAMTASILTADLPVHWREPRIAGSPRLLGITALVIGVGSFIVFAQNSFLSHSNTSILIMIAVAYETWRRHKRRRADKS